MAPTRRTHIVRVPLDEKPTTPPASYADIEVLDAIAFRTENGDEVILNMSNSDPFTVDDTGGNHDKSPSQPTQRTHMKRIVNPKESSQKLDVEVLDCWAATDQNGDVWILDLQPGSDSETAGFSITDGDGDGQATRRVHTEIITSPAGKKKSDAQSSYLTSIRSDAIAFRKVRGEEVILVCPSCDDDVNDTGTSFKRAETFMTPEDYDPTNDKDPTPPPLLSDTDDKHTYIAAVKGGSFFTGDAKIAMGPFWWLRKIKGGELWIRLDTTGTDSAISGFFCTACMFPINTTPNIDPNTVHAPALFTINNEKAPAKFSTYTNATPILISEKDIKGELQFTIAGTIFDPGGAPPPNPPKITGFGSFRPGGEATDHGQVESMCFIQPKNVGGKFTFWIELTAGGGTPENLPVMSVRVSTFFKDPNPELGQEKFPDAAIGKDIFFGLDALFFAHSASAVTPGPAGQYMAQFEIDTKTLEVKLKDDGSSLHRRPVTDGGGF
jgi:hypothetical protein